MILWYIFQLIIKIDILLKKVIKEEGNNKNKLYIISRGNDMMPFNSEKNGFQNEDEFVSKLNNKKICDLNFNFQLFIYDTFGNIDSNKVVKCIKNTKLQKYDIFIKIDKNEKRISIKKGVKNSVHTEPISEFIHFLIENNMPRYMIINFLKYHYADGTTNGSGVIRLSSLEYKKYHQKEIDEINDFINNESFLKKCIDRFILVGRNSNDKVDIVIYGVPNDFIWISANDIYDIMLSHKDDYSTGIHFSNLFYQPLNRCINHNPKYEKCRYVSQLKW